MSLEDIHEKSLSIDTLGHNLQNQVTYKILAYHVYKRPLILHIF